MSNEQAKGINFEITTEYLNIFSHPYSIGYHKLPNKNSLVLAKNKKNQESQLCSVIYPSDHNYNLDDRLPSLFFCCPIHINTESIKELNLNVKELLENIQIAKERLQKFEL